MVIMAQPFGRVMELWSLDMGLGPVEPRFIAVHEHELNPVVVNGEDDPAEVEDHAEEDAAQGGGDDQ
ncbi:hypothetical protein ACET3Z_026778 [Daucus carota]